MVETLNHAARKVGAAYRAMLERRDGRLDQVLISIKVPRAIRSGHHDLPDEYIRRHQSGDGVSTRHIKQVMVISELRSESYNIATGDREERYGFKYHRLERDPGPQPTALPLTRTRARVL